MVVGVYRTLADAEDHGLVVLAMGLDYWVHAEAIGFQLLVPAVNEAAVREQLTLFDLESINWPPPPVAEDRARFQGLQLTPLLWAAAVVFAYGLQQDSPGRLESAGALDALALLDRGEWWRPVTALFLHGGVGHLTGNLFAGYFVFALVLSYFERVRGWLLLATAAVGGNLLAAAIHYPGVYRSMGASTAIFAGLGLMTGRALAFAIRGRGWRYWRPIFSPLAAGAVLLGLFGAGDMATDVVAHTTGFGVGLGYGVIFTGRKPVK